MAVLRLRHIHRYSTTAGGWLTAGGHIDDGCVTYQQQGQETDNVGLDIKAPLVFKVRPKKVRLSCACDVMMLYTQLVALNAG